MILGLTQVLAVGLKKPLGVSTQFVVVTSNAAQKVAPGYAAEHKEIQNRLKFGYGWWLDVGLVGGALLAAIVTLRWQFRATTVWWRASHGSAVFKRLLFGFLGGIAILLGARIAGGCASDSTAHPERFDELISEIAMGRSILEW